jgi:phosphatidylglycerophosphate synthase
MRPGQIVAWLRRVHTPSDWLSALRLALAPVLWVLAARRKRRAVGAGIVVTATTDMVDGGLARLRHDYSEFGAQLDAVADMAIILSAPAWMAMLYPDVLRRRRRTLLAMSGVAALLLAIEWRKFRKAGAMHIDSARAASVLAHGYVLLLFVRGKDSDLLFRGFVLLGGVAAIETAYIIATRDDFTRLTETPLLDDLLAAAGLPNPLGRLPFHDPGRR